MSLQRHILNLSLRRLEKPYLARESDPLALRQGFEAKARFWFRSPKDVRFRWDDLAGLPALWVEPETVTSNAVLLYFHGGGYVFGSPDTHKAMLARLASMAGVRACLPRYRLAPENAFPAAVEDARHAWSALSAEGRPAGHVLLGGDSAGGGLALALLADICSGIGPRPAGLFAFSPLTDLTFSGQSFTENAQADVLLPATRDRDLIRYYLQGADPGDPRASPLFAGFSGAPPVRLMVGDTEILLDDTLRMAARLREQEVAVELEVAHDLPHVWPIFHALLPEARTTLRSLAGWITGCLPPSNGS